MWILLQASERAAELPAGYGAALLQGIVSLAAVCLLAWVLLRFGSRRGFGTSGGQRIKVLERAHLDARRSLYLVEVADKVMLLGAGDGGGPELIAEVDADALPPVAERGGLSFADVLKRVRGEAPAEPDADAPSDAEGDAA